MVCDGLNHQLIMTLRVPHDDYYRMIDLTPLFSPLGPLIR